MSSWCQTCKTRPVEIEKGRQHDFCGRYCADQARGRSIASTPIHSPACKNCKIRPRNGVHSFCDPSCASDFLGGPIGKPAMVNGGMCQYCGIRPHAQGHPYCGRYCASRATGSAVGMCRQCRAQPRNGAHQFCNKACASKALGTGGQIAASQSAGPWYKPIFATFNLGRSSSQGARPQINFYDRNAPYYGFTNFSDHIVKYMGKKYPTSEHLYQAFKFIGHRDDLAERIRTASSRPRDAFEAAGRWKQYQRSDWMAVNISTMDKVLKLKFERHSTLRDELMSTQDAELIEDSPYDSFWGIGKDGKGQNQLGKALERLRTDFKSRGY